MGCAWVGFTQESRTGGQVLDLQSWNLQLGSSLDGVSVVTDSLSHIALEYKPTFPLHVILTQESLDRYNSVFRFLFLMKRLQYRLQRVGLMKKSLQCQNLWHLRLQMLHFIDSFSTYVQVDVIEQNTSTLIRNINNSASFDDVKA